MTRLVVHVERLVLRGFATEDHVAIGESLRAELERQLAEAGIARRFEANGDVSRMLAGTVRIGHRTTPQHIGRRVAKSIGAGVNK
jgi:hypothetical protein